MKHLLAILHVLAAFAVTPASAATVIYIDSYRFGEPASPPPPGGATFIAASASTYSASGNALIVPDGVNDGDLLIALTNNQLWNPGWTVVPSGWTRAGLLHIWGDQYGGSVYYKIASSEPASYDIAGAGWSFAVCLAYSGATTVDTVGSWTTTNATGPIVTSSILPSSGALVLSLVLFRQGFPLTTITAPAGFTERVNEAPDGSTAFLLGAAEMTPAPGANANWSVGGSFLWSAGIQIAIK